MSVNANNPRIKFTNDDSGESLELDYRYPLTDKSGDSRTNEHQCIGTNSVIQHLGANAEEIRFRGHCYWDEADFLLDLRAASRVTIRSARHKGPVVVTNVEIIPNGGGGGGPRANLAERNLRYRLTALEVTDAPFADGQNQGGGEGGST